VKPKVAFIDYGLHKESSSGVFMRNLFRKFFEVVNFWDTEYCVDEINNEKYEFVFFFQYIPTFGDLKRINHKVLWAPMYDGMINFPDYLLLPYSTLSNLSILSFCEALTKRMSKFSFRIMTVKYFINPKKFSRVSDYGSPKLFFWPRSDVGYDEMKGVFDMEQFKSVFIRYSFDRGHGCVLPVIEDKLKSKVTVSEVRYKTKTDYWNVQNNYNVYFSSRTSEGIGLGFIEPMAMGMVVVAKDEPTMNEYIINGVNGILINNFNHKLDISNYDLKLIGDNARNSCRAGYKKWSEEKSRIIDFMKNVKNSNIKYDLHIKLMVVLYYLKFRFTYTYGRLSKIWG